MRGKKVKLGDVLIKKNLRFKDVPDLKEPLVLGVTNNEGVVKSKVEAGQKIEDYYVINKGDFVYNPYRINVGSIGISDLEGITSLAYVVFNVDETRLNKYLLFKLLKSDFGLKEIIRNGRGSVRNALRFDDLARIELVIPSIEEQNAFIDDFKKKEEKLELLKTNYTYQLTQLENLNQAILQEAVQGKLVNQNPDDEPSSELLKRIKVQKAKLGKKEKALPPIKPEEIPFEIPGNWVWCRLGEICDVLGGFAFDSTRYSKVETQNQVIRLGNVKPNQLILETSPVYIDDEYSQEVEKSILKEKDILITMTGTKAKRDYLFSLCLNNADLLTKKLFLNQRVGCFRFNDFIFSEFINYALKDWALITPVYESSTGAANQANIGVAALKEILIPLPPGYFGGIVPSIWVKPCHF